MIKRIFLVGNPNVGKSVVFSRLTGVDVIVSNYPGTTVEITKNHLKIENQQIEVIDLPGLYSFEPTSKAEEVTASILKQEQKDQIALVNIIDATNLERNLYLTLHLIEEGYPLIICLNMYDEMIHHGISIDVGKLETMLGVPVIPTCAVTGMGIKALIERIKEAKANPKRRALGHLERWQEIGKVVEAVQHLTHRHHTIRELLEDASVRPLTGILIAATVLYSSFEIVRFIAETLITNIAEPFFSNIYYPFVHKISEYLAGKGLLHHLLIGELVNSNIDFRQSFGLLTTAPYIEFAMVLPYIISFYFVLSFLEDIGFLPRLAILLDNVFHSFGLHGYAIIPVLLGFGCNVPGILATRILESKKERFIVSTLISIGVPCIPLQAMIFGLLGQYSGFYVLGVYLVLFAIWLILGVILNRLTKGYSPEFLLEIPPYRFPPLVFLFKKLFVRIKVFLLEALPLVFLGVLLVNVLLYFRLLDFLTTIFSPVISGLFGLPKESVIALFIGFLRKDVAVGMLLPLHLSVKQLFIAATLLAVSFPCIATFAIMLKELGVKALLKAIMIMLAAGLIVGTILNLGIIS